MICDIQKLGSGLGYRYEISDKIYENKSKIDFVEIISESYFHNDVSFERLRALSDDFRVIPHGVSLSIGSPTIDNIHLQNIKRVCDVIDPPFYSDHMCVSKCPGISTGHLTPMWFTKEVLKQTVENIKLVQDYLERPLVLENITYYFDIPDADYTQEAFFNEVVDQTGCGILLDVANIVANSNNHNFDPFEFIDNMPLDNLVQVHIAGGFETKDNIIIDSHDRPVSDQSWKLLKYVSKKSNIKATLLEHDSNFPDDFSMLTKQLIKARGLM